MKKISIIIKALNEEKHIAKCIESAINALKGLTGEVILVDSLSKDKTIEITKKYPIKIIQLRENWFKSPAAALHTGYNYSSGDYILVLDGDMTLNKDFIKNALTYFSDKKVAAVGGKLKDSAKTTNLFKYEIRLRKKLILKPKDTLAGCMLIKRDAINKLDFFVNPYLFADEEAEFCYRLEEKGFKLLRMEIESITHFGWEQDALSIFFGKFKNKYLYGPGQVLRYSLGNKLFWKHLIRHRKKIYVTLWLLLGLAGLILLSFTNVLMYLFLIASILFFTRIYFYERNIKDTFLLFIDWNLKAIGLILGFMRKPRDVKSYPTNAKIIKN